MAERKRRLAWLRPPVAGPGGTMTLASHLRELRYRFLVAFAAVLLTTAFCLFFEAQLLQVVLWPINRAVEIYQANRPDGRVELVTQGITAAFALYFRVCFVAGVILACPVWLYQLWRFIIPALHTVERKVVAGYLASAIPLFLLGVVVGYAICPRGFAVLLGFNPPSVMNLNDIGTFLSFELRLLLIFGLAFLLPVLLVSLNRLGLVSGQALGKFRMPAVVLCGAFSAIATPTTDALTMLALMVPMIAMYLVAEAMCRLHDRKKLSADADPSITNTAQQGRADP